MTIQIEIHAAAPSTTVQDGGRKAGLRFGISTGGPMDMAAYQRAGAFLARPAETCLEFARGKLSFKVTGGSLEAAFTGGQFNLEIEGRPANWEDAFRLAEGATATITPGESGKFGYVRFDREIDVPRVVGSRSTNLIAGIGGFEGRPLQAGDFLRMSDAVSEAAHSRPPETTDGHGPAFRFVWGVHADLLSDSVRQAFLNGSFVVSTQFDRMGARLEDSAGVFARASSLSLVSDVVVPGDIQILGGGTPVVLMRDHQPTGGYPRIATIIPPDLDRLAQTRPGTEICFEPVSVSHAHRMMGVR